MKSGPSNMVMVVIVVFMKDDWSRENHIFHYMNFSFDAFQNTFLFAKVRISLSVYKLHNSTML